MEKSTNRFDKLASEWDNNPAKLERAVVTADKIRRFNLTCRGHAIDFGCGTGLLGLQFADYFEQVHLADASSEMLGIAQAKIERAGIANVTVHQVSTLCALPVTASAIMMLMVLHHIHGIEDFFRHAYDKLEQGGVLIVADLCKEDGSFHKGVSGFDGHNGFDTDVLANMATAIGFEVTCCEPYYDIHRSTADGTDKTYPLFMMMAQKAA